MIRSFFLNMRKQLHFIDSNKSYSTEIFLSDVHVFIEGPIFFYTYRNVISCWLLDNVIFFLVFIQMSEINAAIGSIYPTSIMHQLRDMRSQVRLPVRRLRHPFPELRQPPANLSNQAGEHILKGRQRQQRPSPNQQSDELDVVEQ